MSDLRDRIAAVIVQHHTGCDETVDGTWTQCQCDAGWRREDEWAVHVADAVIAELGLRENFAVADADGDFVYVGADRESSAKYTVHPGDHLLRRYVTDWKADDE